MMTNLIYLEFAIIGAIFTLLAMNIILKIYRKTNNRIIDAIELLDDISAQYNYDYWENFRENYFDDDIPEENKEEEE